MKNIMAALFLILALFPGSTFAYEGGFGGSPPNKSPLDKEEKPLHLLDGATIEYQYQNGWAIHMEIYNGMLKYKWIAGPFKGTSNKNLPYRSRRIGENIFVVNWYEESKPDFITLIFNFENNVMYSSGILFAGKEKQFSLFHGGIIDEFEMAKK